MDLLSNTAGSEGQKVLQRNNTLAKSKLQTTLYILQPDDSQLYFFPDWVIAIVILTAILRRRHTFISGCWFPQRAQAIWRLRIESLALGIPFIEPKQFGRHVPVGVYHIYEHHVAMPEALLLQGGILLPQPGGVVLHPGWAAPQEPRQTVSIYTGSYITGKIGLMVKEFQSRMR